MLVRIRLGGDSSSRILTVDTFKMRNHLTFIVERLSCERQCLSAHIVWNDAHGGMNVYDPGGPTHVHP